MKTVIACDNFKDALNATKVCRSIERGIPIVTLYGAVDMPPQYIRDLGLLGTFSIGQKPTSLEEALADTAKNLEKAAFNVARIFKC